MPEIMVFYRLQFCSLLLLELIFYKCYLYSFTHAVVPTRFPCQTIFVSTGGTFGAGIANLFKAHEFTPSF